MAADYCGSDLEERVPMQWIERCSDESCQTIVLPADGTPAVQTHSPGDAQRDVGRKQL